MADAIPNMFVPEPDQTFDTGAAGIAVNGTNTWSPIAEIQVMGRDALIQGVVGANAITDFKLVVLPHPAAQPNDLAVDADFSSATETIPCILPALPATTNTFSAANSSFTLDVRSQAWSLRVYAKSAAATTLRILGNVLGRHGIRP